MDIKTMIDSHQEMIATISASLKERGFDQALLGRPVELQEERAIAVKARIEALEAARRDYVAKVDGDIATLKGELSTIDARIKTERQTVATVLKASAAKPPADRAIKDSPGAAVKRTEKSRPATASATKSSAKRRKGGP